VELLISLALGLAVLVGLSAVYVAAKQSFRFQETGGRMQEDAMFAMETISRELRMAGFAGCRGVEKINIAGVDTYFPNLGLTTGAPGGISGPNPLAAVEPLNAEVILKPLSPSNFVRGFDSVPAAMFAVAPTSSATDSLFIAGGSARAASVTATMAAAGDPLTIAAGSAAFLDPSKIYNMVVSNCNSSSLFAGQVAGGGTQIAHTTAIGNATVGTNAANSFPSAPLYGADAIVMPLEWSFYYVATRAGAATPSLYRVAYDGNARGNAEELVSNVESMRLHYGENTANNPDGSPTMQADVWRTTAASVVNWPRVVAVRVGLMMVSEDNAANRDVVTADPPLLGASYAGPAGRSATRLRKEFSTTVVLRNRIAPR
ncbi:MAG TPA: PilW family protein, partial [Burkholderiaceae bacterium]|nr:PilW family protein [Burkholderiaceae bacterium]